MADAKYRDLILDTIDQLRKRKARPDLERISHMLDRRHGVSASEVETDLEKLVDGEIVIKVDYKGSTSYRNAAKWRRSHLGGHVLNSSDTSLFIGNIIATLCGDSGDREQGVSIHDVEKYVGTEKPDSDLCTKGRLLVALQREVDVGALKRLPNGNYARGNPADVKKASKLHGKGLGHGKAGGPGQGKSSGGPGKAGSTPGRKAGQTAKRK
ncbi:PREDICTED: uncharacterized protein LOC106805547, partial [Priapulus caudatus]|uniref:Uncharacterized protein LOC106805547 n=1 Tax=Priapulus caudatus TaxID=37621 RepID=A0ABM1DRV0_PRICU